MTLLYKLQTFKKRGYRLILLDYLLILHRYLNAFTFCLIFLKLQFIKLMPKGRNVV